LKINCIKKALNLISRTNCVFSPNDKLLVTVTSTKSSDDQGKMIVYEREGLIKLHEVDITNSVIYLFTFLFINFKYLNVQNLNYLRV
jgi:hypothetical protein